MYILRKINKYIIIYKYRYEYNLKLICNYNVYLTIICGKIYIGCMWREIMINTRKIPKIEIHCHLDGSLRIESVKDELIKQNINVGKITEKDMKVSLNCESLVEYLKAFDLPLKVLQKKDSIERFTYEVFEDAYNEGCVYLELRFAPILHIENGLNLEDIIESTIKGLDRAKKDLGIEGGIILCCMKNFSLDDAIRTVEAGKKFIGKGVVGVDLAGPEDEGFANKFIDVMDLANRYGYNITVHAGEAGSAKNVRDSIEKLHAKRIGHGIRSIEDDGVLALIKKNNIHLETCPTSNVQTKAVLNLENHPIQRFITEGYSASINTDNRTVSDTTMVKEIDIVDGLFGIDMDEYSKMYYNTVDAIFQTDDIKDKLRKTYEEYMYNVEVK